jgi:hypothetical protein
VLLTLEALGAAVVPAASCAAPLVRTRLGVAGWRKEAMLAEQQQQAI